MNHQLRFAKAMQDDILRQASRNTHSGPNGGRSRWTAAHTVRSAVGNALIRAGTRVRPSPEARHQFSTSQPC